MILTWYSPSGVEIEFSKDSDTYRLLKNYTGFAEQPVAHITRQAPYEDGVTLINSHFEPRELSFDILVTAPTLTDLKYAVRVLSTALNPLQGKGTLIYTDEDGSRYFLTCIGNSTPTMSNAVKTGTVWLATIDLIAHDDPFWNSYPGHIAYFGAGTPLVYPFTYPYTYPVGTPTTVLINTGNVAAAAKIVITGEIVNPSIARTYTDADGNSVTETLAFTLSMTAGEVLTITTGYGNKTITLLHSTGSYDTNPFQYLNAGSIFWQVVPGQNSVTVSDTSIASATRTSVQYSDKFSGVG